MFDNGTSKSSVNVHRIVRTETGFQIKLTDHMLEWNSETDICLAYDSKNRQILSFPLQPAIKATKRKTSPGKAEITSLSNNKVSIKYKAVNYKDSIELNIELSSLGIKFNKIKYQASKSNNNEDVQLKEIIYWARWETKKKHDIANSNAITPQTNKSYTAKAGMKSGYLVHPGFSESSALAPIIPTDSGLKITSWLGRGAHGNNNINSQQWGLPVHYFAGLSYNGSMLAKNANVHNLSDAFCMGLAEVPHGDLVMRQSDRYFSPELRVYSNIHKHMPLHSGGSVLGGSTVGGSTVAAVSAADVSATEASTVRVSAAVAVASGEEAGLAGTNYSVQEQNGSASDSIEIGTVWLLNFSSHYRNAIENYYQDLLNLKVINKVTHSQKKQKLLESSQFNTWGAQCASDSALSDFNEKSLKRIYNDMKSNGMKAGIFVIDDKWEGNYGLLKHDSKRFPNFIENLAQIRSEGHAIGMWAAFLRCDNPKDLGLEVSDMLQDNKSEAIKLSNRTQSYYLFDISREKVRKILRERIHFFAKTYSPDLVKFDFGYELPDLSRSIPYITSWGGEKILFETVKFISESLREVNPDIILMYYNLSPLFNEYIDLHAIDDMFLASGDYPQETNRRLFFGSIMNTIGVSTYGSSAYDWYKASEIFFDSFISGSLGSLHSFSGDPINSKPDALSIANFNGLSNLRKTPGGKVIALHDSGLAGNSNAMSHSWAYVPEDTACSISAIVLRDVEHKLFNRSNININDCSDYLSNNPAYSAASEWLKLKRNGTIAISCLDSNDLLESKHWGIVMRKQNYLGEEENSYINIGDIRKDSIREIVYHFSKGKSLKLTSNSNIIMLPKVSSYNDFFEKNIVKAEEITTSYNAVSTENTESTNNSVLIEWLEVFW